MDGQHRRGYRRPKIAGLLAEPRAAAARDLITAARSHGVAPTLYDGLRLPTLTYLYEDPGFPERVTSSVGSPAYVADDHALLEGLARYENALCACGVPRSVGWHSDMDGWFEGDEYVCFACTALRGEGAAPVIYTVLRNTRPASQPLPPFQMVPVVKPDSSTAEVTE